MSEYGGNKGQKVQWMIDNVAPEPSAAIIQQARTEGWLCSGKDGTGGWTDFKAGRPGLDSLYDSLPEPGEVQEAYVPQSPSYPFEMDDLGDAAPMQQQGMMMQQEPQPPTPEDFSGRDGRRHNYTIAEKRAFIEDLNTRVPQEHAVALGSSPTHNQLNTI